MSTQYTIHSALRSLLRARRSVCTTALGMHARADLPIAGRSPLPLAQSYPFCPYSGNSGCADCADRQQNGQNLRWSRAGGGDRKRRAESGGRRAGRTAAWSISSRCRDLRCSPLFALRPYTGGLLSPVRRSPPVRLVLHTTRTRAPARGSARHGSRSGCCCVRTRSRAFGVGPDCHASRGSQTRVD
jgi:hypothetical protein